MSSLPLALLRMTDGLVVHQALCAAATLGIADLLTDGERSAAELASTLRVNDDALYRTLRFLSGHGVFRETGAGTFVNSPLSEYMRSDVPNSVRAVLIFRGGRYYFSPFTEFLSSVETGVPARDKVLGNGTFDYLRADPESERNLRRGDDCAFGTVGPRNRCHLRLRTLGNGDRRRRRHGRTPGQHPARPSPAPRDAG